MALWVRWQRWAQVRERQQLHGEGFSHSKSTVSPTMKAECIFSPLDFESHDLLWLMGCTCPSEASSNG